MAIFYLRVDVSVWDKELKKYKKIFPGCEYRFEKRFNHKFSEGFYCQKNSLKCSVNLCPRINNDNTTPSIFPQETKPKGNEGVFIDDKKIKKHPPSWYMENKNLKNSDVSNTLTLPSCSSDRQEKALMLYNEGMGYNKISRVLNISKQSAKELIIRAYRNNQNRKNLRTPPLTLTQKDTLTVRLHNDEFCVKVLVDYDLINSKVFNKGRNLEYKLIIKDSDFYIKLHKNNSLTFRFLKDIVGRTEVDVLDLANCRLVNFLDTFSFGGIVLVSKERVLSRHYGLLGSSLAKKVREDRTQIIIKDVDGKIRLRVDFSNEHAEIDAESVKTGKLDINVTREYLQSILDKPHYRPDEVKSILDTIIKVQSEYAFAINNHNQAVVDISSGIKELKDVVKELKK